MVEFNLCIPMNLKFGVDVINRLGNVVLEISPKDKKVKPIIITEGILHESGMIKRIMEILTKKNCEPILFDDVVLNAASDVVVDGIKKVRSSYSNLVIGLGGVRALSIAKAIACFANGSGTISDYIDGKEIDCEPLPYIEIPSTPRNPFMFKDELWLTDYRNRNSVILKLNKNSTKYIIFDPMITTTLTRRLTATTIIDTFANAFEGYISTKSNFLSDMFFLKAMELFNNNIFPATTNLNDIYARANLSFCGLLTSLGLNMTTTGITAALSYVLSSKYKIHKSLTSCVILPHVMDYNITACPEKFVQIAIALGENITGLSVVEAAIKAIEKVRKIIIELQLPIRLEEFDLNKDDLIIVADEAKKFDMFNYLPRSCDTEELYAILQASY